MGKKKKTIKLLGENIAFDTTQGIGLITTGALTSKIPAAGAGAWSNVMAGQEIGSVASVVRGAKLPIQELQSLSKTTTKRTRRKKKRK